MLLLMRKLKYLIYLARLVKPPSHFYQIDEEYIITEPRADGYYSVFFKHRPDCPPIGAYKRNDCFEYILSLEESVTDTATIFEVGDIVEINGCITYQA